MQIVHQLRLAVKNKTRPHHRHATRKVLKFLIKTKILQLQRKYSKKIHDSKILISQLFRTPKSSSRKDTSTSESEIKLDDKDSESECTICMEEFKNGDHVRYLPCMHFYHQICIDDWLLRSFTCPRCMEKVDVAIMASFAQQLS